MVTLADISLQVGQQSLRVDDRGEVVLAVDGVIMNDDIELARVQHLSGGLPKNIHISAKLFGMNIGEETIIAASVFVLAINDSDARDDRIGISNQTFKVIIGGSYDSSLDEDIRQALRQAVLNL